MVQDYPDYSLGAMVQTLLADNIIIDKLKVGAYTSRAAWLTWDNGVTTPDAPPDSETGTSYRGKFFPRGCRGHIVVVRIYCKRTGTGTITLAFAPHPGAGEIKTVTVTPGTAWDWKEATGRIMWNYDAMFIYIKSIGADVSWGKDTAGPDMFYSTNSGATWISSTTARMFIRVLLRGMTCGDVPVSGTINTIEIPSQSQERLFNQISVGTTETTLKEVFGAGKTEYVVLRVAVGTDSHLARMRIYCDGNLSFDWTYSALNIYSYAASTPGISLTLYGTDTACVVHLTIRFSFLRHLKVTFQNVTSAKTSTVDGLVNLMK